MGLDKLKLQSSGGDFSVMVNPNEFKLNEAISYSFTGEERNLKFNAYKKAAISFPKIILDTTGAIPKELWPMDGSIKDMIEKLKKVGLYYDSSNDTIYKNESTYIELLQK